MFGPYYLKTGGEIEKITDPKSWRKIDGTDFSFVSNITSIEVFSKFLDLISSDKADMNSEYPFDFELNSEDPSIRNSNPLNELTKKYFDNLKQAAPMVFESVTNLFKTIVQGKRYSIFYKIPTLYIKTIEELMFHRIDYSLIKQTRDYYATICDFLDQQTQLLIHPDFLTHVNGKDKFSFKEILKIDVNNLDLNYDIESIIDIIQQGYPKLLPAVQIIAKMQMIGTSIPDLLDYNYDFIKVQVKDVVPTNVFSGFKEYENWLKDIFVLFTSVDKNKVNYAINSLMNNTKEPNEKVRLDTSNPILSSIEEEVFFNQIVYPRVVIANNLITKTIDEIKSINFSNRIEIVTDSYITKVSSSYWQPLKYLATSNPLKITPKLLSTLIFATNMKIRFPIEDYINSSDVVSNNLLEQFINRFWSFTNVLLPYETLKKPFFGYALKTLMNLSKVIFPVINIVLSDNFRKAVSTINDVLDKANSIIDLMSGVGTTLKFVPFIGYAIAGLEFILNIFKIERNSYIFESEDASFIWNGGESQSFFLA